MKNVTLRGGAGIHNEETTHAQPDALVGEIIDAQFSLKKDRADDQVILLRYGPGKSQEIICFDAALQNDNNLDVHIFHM